MSGTTKSLGAKDELDKFYTRPGVAAHCLNRLDELVGLETFARIIEPSAGAGAFSDLLFARRGARTVRAFDLAPENRRVKEQDWFAYSTKARGKTLVVGNPPFGRQSNLAVRFINHAFDVVGADTVAFVLPRGFRKQSTQARLYPHAALMLDLNLDYNAFTLHGQNYGLSSVFQVWQRTAVARPALTGSLRSDHATFTRKQMAHHMIVRRVGGRAGTAFMPEDSASEQSNYFLRLDSPKPPLARDVVRLINGLDFTEARNGTGPNSLSKREFVRRFDAAYLERFGA